jgi:hypothetical protein
MPISPKGCLSGSLLVLLSLWSLLVGGLVVAGWLAATVLAAVLDLLLDETGTLGAVASWLLALLRALGFGALATVWAIGAAVLAVLWVTLLRARRAQAWRETRVIEIEAVDITPPGPPQDGSRPPRDGPPPALPPR